MIYLNAQSVSTNEYESDLFGANILASRDQIGEDGTYDEAAAQLGVENMRYPGGSLTEDYFDLSNPDATEAIDPDTGRTVELLPYTEFMNYAEENDIAVSIVLPTRNYLSDNTDGNGHRYVDIDEPELRSFIQDTLDGEYGAPTIKSFEVGNEYWGSGEMSSLEYGRVSARMAEILADEISNHPNAEVFEDLDVLVQNGQNYGTAKLNGEYNHLTTGEQQLAAINEDYGLNLSDEDYIFNSGDVAWPKVANAIILSEYDTDAEREAVDGLSVHIYSKGADRPNSREYDLRTVDQTWMEELGDDLSISVTEWNLKASRTGWDPEEEYGLKQAHEMLNMTEDFVAHGVDAGYVWAVQQNNLTNLSGNEGDEFTPRVPGEMFRWMNESLPDMQSISFQGDRSDETEEVAEDTSVHAFYDEDRFVSFIASNVDEDLTSEVDFTQIFADSSSIHIEVLGVLAGQNPTSPEATAQIRTIDPEEAFEDGVLSVDLNPYEIIRVVVEEPDYTNGFDALVDAMLGGSPDTAPDDIPIIPETDDTDSAPDGGEGEDAEEPDAAPGDGGGSEMGGLGALLGLLPLLALLGGGF